MYITPTQLAEGAGMLKELAESFGVAADLMTATIADGDRSAWTADEIAVADKALLEIEATCDRADAEINAYLVKRGYAMPLSSTTFPVLTVWARNVVRYHLQPQRDRTNEETGRIERDYRATLNVLMAVAGGKLGLGVGDPIDAAAAAVDGPAVFSEPRIFTRSQMRGL